MGFIDIVDASGVRVAGDPPAAQPGITHCAPFDSHFGLCIPKYTDPDTSAGTIDTSVSRFGNASLLSGRVVFNAVTPPDDTIAIQFWYNTFGADQAAFGVFLGEVSDPGRTNLSLTVSSASGLEINLLMADSGGTVRINANSTEAGTTPDSSWHHVELNAKCNDGSGSQKVYWDGTVKISSTAMNAYQRTDGNDYKLNFDNGFGEGFFNTDDFAMANVLFHTSNFTPTQAPKCIDCSKGGDMFNNFGAPFWQGCRFGR